jgi:hypothetical protein
MSALCDSLQLQALYLLPIVAHVADMNTVDCAAGATAITATAAITLYVLQCASNNLKLLPTSVWLRLQL